MDLFNTENTQNTSDKIANLLPYDGVVNYFGKILPQNEIESYFDSLLHTLAWENDEAIIFGKHITTARKVAWYGEKAYFYKYSGISKTALLWTSELLSLKNILENLTGNTFNSCLCNLYHNGNEGMGWHSDDDKYLQKNSPIASLSFGAERKFSFKHKKSKENNTENNIKNVDVLLENGSLLLMKDDTQTNWLHSLPKTTKIQTPRINLTFRTILMPVIV